MTDKSDSTSSAEEITFEQGYEQLKTIVDRLAQEDVPVQEMFDLFRRGKGLEKSLRGYLEEHEGELEEIEAGEGLPEFKVVAPSGGDAPASDSTGEDIPF